MSTSNFSVSSVSSVKDFDIHLSEFFLVFDTDLSQYSGQSQFFEAVDLSQDLSNSILRASRLSDWVILGS